MKNWKHKKIAGKFIVLLDGTDEVSVWIDKKKGFIYRRSYYNISNAIRAYNNINSVKAIKRFVGKDWNKLYRMALR